ncbi:tRNA endonuclease ANKZF1-like [Acropora palmata]|uniref:tRNA endonuclease ANKZF1-like n=1 Tax=Acropora palmata TaxID=6131 RepID=UPI003DA1ADDC
MSTVKRSRSSTLSLFDEQLQAHFRGLHVRNDRSITCGDSGSADGTLSVTETENNGNENLKETSESRDKTGVSCSVCIVVFDSVGIQREHFKLDWHRFNLKQKVAGKPVLSEDAFEETISGELSSISGSDSDTDSDSDLTLGSSHRNKSAISNMQPVIKKQLPGHHHARVLFEDGDVLSVYCSVLYSAKNVPTSSEVMVSLLQKLPTSSYWIILMTAGGHFAAAVFRGKEILTHKTFHRYTVRAKRGTAQGARDALQGGKQPKSAGATLRRYNEAALLQEVQDLLETWSQHVELCDRIFIRTPAYNKSLFFGGKKPPLKKDDERIRTIPFATKRPTFNEVRRVHQELSSVLLLGNKSNKELLGILKEPTETKAEESFPSVEEDMIETLREQQNSDNKIEENDAICSRDNKDKMEEREQQMVSVIQPKVTRKKNGKKKAKSKKGAEIGFQRKEQASPEQRLWNRLYCAVVSGDKEVISLILGVRGADAENNSSHHRDNCSPKEAKEELDCNNAGILNAEQLTEPSENEKDRSCSHNFVSTSDSLRIDNAINDNEGCSGIERNDCNGDNSPMKIAELINGRYGGLGETLLHGASRFSQTEILLMLLNHGADPAVKNDRGKPPFAVAGNKETRNEFRRFMALYPDRYDYTKAQIPSALTPEMELERRGRNAEKKKAQKAKAQKQRAYEEEQKIAQQKKEEEAKGKKAVAALSEREKRALAAEKRFAQQLATKQTGTTSSCQWCCASLDLLVPFERLSFKYCSTACVKAHRLDIESQNKRYKN